MHIIILTTLKHIIISTFVLQIYGMSLINVFLISSTYLVVLTAIIRYFAVATPFRSRNNSCVKHSGFASLLIFCVVVFMALPQVLHEMIVRHDGKSNNTSGVSYYTLQTRFNQRYINTIDCYINRIYPVLSSFLPCLILIIFNVGLIYQLRRAKIARRYVCVIPQLASATAADGGCNWRLTITLILMFTAHIVLVAPSDIVKYFAFYDLGDQLGDIIACMLNLMQTCNFALNFVLFISLNSSFRDTFCLMVANLFGCKKRRHSSSMSVQRHFEAELIDVNQTGVSTNLYRSRPSYPTRQLTIDSQ